MIATGAVVVLVVTSVLLFGFGLNLLFLTLCALRLPLRRLAASPTRKRGNDGAQSALRQPVPRKRGGPHPHVCVQVPIYNERYVAERVLDAVCELDWPRDRLEVQALDDSDDESVQIVARRVAHWAASGTRIFHLRRGTREGFKAGALAYGMEKTQAELIAVFDADFVPPRDFLRRTTGVFDDPRVAFVQARWGHLDESYSWFTRLQALFIDFHFLVEQSVRSARGYFVNFTGSAGVWRRAAIEDAGGWTASTLTEDLDLSYRAQLRGWKTRYLEDLVVPEELPVSIDAYRTQQSRWATGSFQCAFRLLGPVWRSGNRLGVKVQATIHLLAYGVGPLMLIQLLCYPTLLLAVGRQNIPWQISDALLLGVWVAASPWVGFIVAQVRRGRPWWTGLPAVMCQVIGAGMSLNVIFALVAALRPGGVFVRTPKHRIERRGQEWRDQEYVRVGDPRAILEAILGAGALAILPLALRMDQVLLAIYSGLFAVGFLTVAALSASDLLQVLALRRLGRRALAGARMAAPVAALFGGAGLLLVLAAQMGEPFEDGYGHWLIAANLASTGRLHDPLFNMQDTWLPAYQVLSAAVLKVFGLWQLGLLKAMSAAFGLVTAACVYAIAPSRRQGVIALALLVLNPVFLFTSGSAVVEPMLTALLLGAGLAATRGHMKVASALAAAACVTSTKAWIWVGAVVALVVVDTIRERAGARALAWAVPAVAVLAFFQLGFSPATHSVARGSVEVLSAGARGSIPAGALGRVSELATTYGLAALPLVVFAALGLVRRHSSGLWRFVYLPSGVYLAAVFGLVAAGAYSGSHRYLYPALPAAALLAAAALDRYAIVVRTATVAAAAMLAVGFTPIFTAFAAQDAGLVAAGRAASCTPGGLLTDSPVAAYYSGKQPSRIAGSQALPDDRSAAISWLQAHGYDSLVLEDISYYHATTVLPDLTRGEAAPPFTALGSHSGFQVEAGKGVQAYTLGTVCHARTLFGGVTATLPLTPGPGKTAPLAKGVALNLRTGSVAGEGMGFGLPIVHYPDGWVYSRSHTDADLSTAAASVWRRTFQLDEMGGDAVHGYAFVPVESRGEIAVTYTVDSSGVSISVKPTWLATGDTEVGLLNEQASSFNDFAADGQPTLIGAAFGDWVPITGGWARLRSARLGVEWSATSLAGATLHAGRESAPPDFDWAGLDYIFPAPFAGASYRITVQEAR